jgi:hypothetical protein
VVKVGSDLSRLLKEAEERGISVQFSPSGISLIISFDDLVKWVTKPFEEAGIGITTEVDYVRRILRIRIPIEYVRAMMQKASPKDYELLRSLLGLEGTDVR